MIISACNVAKPLFHKTLKTSLHRLAGLCKDVIMFYETEPWSYVVILHIAAVVFAGLLLELVFNPFVFPMCLCSNFFFVNLLCTYWVVHAYSYTRYHDTTGAV